MSFVDNLIFFHYRCKDKVGRGTISIDTTLATLLSQGMLEALPLTYEDFLPLSAAGIFQSNLQSRLRKPANLKMSDAYVDKAGFERALGVFAPLT